MYVGERVKVINIHNLPNKNIKYGDTGTVISYENNDLAGVILGIEFDRHINGHDCGGIGKEGFCSFMRKKKLIKID